MSCYRGLSCVSVQSHTVKECLSQNLNSWSMIPSLHSRLYCLGEWKCYLWLTLSSSHKRKLWTSRLLFQQSSPRILLQLLALGKREREWESECVCVCFNEGIFGDLGGRVLTLHCMLLKQMLSVLGYSSQSEQRSRASIFQRPDGPINP